MRRAMTMRTGFMAAGAAALGMASGLGAAQTGDDITITGAAPQSKEFLLTSESDSKAINFDAPREVRVCNDTGSTTSRPAISATGSPLITLQVEHEGMTEQVRPGECYSLEAQRLSVSAAEPLNSGWSLQGRIESREIWSESGQRERTAAAASTGASSAEGSSQQDQPIRTAEADATATTGASDDASTVSGTSTTAHQSQQTTSTATQDSESFREAEEAIRQAQQAMREAEQALAQAESALGEARQAQGEDADLRQATGDDGEEVQRQ